jgi:hypothetical protein
MKLKTVCLEGVLLLLLLTGCGLANRSQPLAATPSAAESSLTAPTLEATETPDGETPTLVENSPAPADTELAQAPQLDANPTVQRDYDLTAPLPTTGQVTIRDNIRNLETDRLIAECPADSAPYAFAESTNYMAQICSAEYDPWLPKYYLGHAKADGSEIWLTNEDHETAQQLIFANDDYTYVLHRDSARPSQTNAYLEVHAPNGTVYAEALLYFYERSDRPFQ